MAKLLPDKPKATPHQKKLNSKMKQTVISTSTIEIKYLKDVSQYTTLCAEWSFKEWGHYTPERSLNDFITARKQYLNDNQLPLTLVAFQDNQPVGMCSLAATRGLLPGLTPWLAALYVEKLHRNQGIGKKLERAVCKKAKNLGYGQIYCFTSDTAVIPWYEKQQWKIRSTEILHNHTVTVLEKKLGSVNQILSDPN